MLMANIAISSETGKQYADLSKRMVEGNNDVHIFSNPNFGEVRVVMNEQGEPMFCASDVCTALGYSNPRKATNDHVDDGDVTKRDTPTASGVQSMTFINESGLYSLIFGSKLETARAFKKWVTSEVLPSIRKHGGYMVAKDDETAEELMARALVVARETLMRKEQRLLEVEAKIVADAPKVLFAEAVETSDSVCLVGELAKILKQNGINMGQNRLYKWLRSHSYLGNKGDNYNLPTQKAMDLGVFKVIKGKRIDKHTGGVIVTRTAKVTTKGLKYFINKFMNVVAVL